MTTKACCDGGLPANDNSKDAPKGELLMLGDLPCYEVGHGAKAVIAVYDIFGFDVKRTKLVCDQISQAGYRVILPDFFRGSDVLKEFGSFPPPGGIEDVVSWYDKTSLEKLPCLSLPDTRTNHLTRSRHSLSLSFDSLFLIAPSSQPHGYGADTC